MVAGLRHHRLTTFHLEIRIGDCLPSNSVSTGLVSHAAEVQGVEGPIVAGKSEEDVRIVIQDRRSGREIYRHMQLVSYSLDVTSVSTAIFTGRRRSRLLRPGASGKIIDIDILCKCNLVSTKLIRAKRENDFLTPGLAASASST